MSTDTEVKLLTLLNVAAIKKARDLDVPGGHRGSPALNSRNTSAQSSPAPAPSSALKGKGPKANGNGGVNGVKKRKSVVFGPEMGPSGSTFGKKAKAEANGKENVNGNADGSGKGKGKGKEVNGNGNANGEVQGKTNGHVDLELDEGSDDEGATVTNDRFNEHFGATSELLSSELISSVDGNEWKSERSSLSGFGRALELRPAGQAGTSESRTRITPAIAEALKKGSSSPLVSTCLGHLGNYRDIYLHSLDGEADGSEKVLFGDNKEAMRKAAMAHALNHVLKTRRKIIRNNEKLAHLTAADPSAAPDPPRDQSFTRPKVLLLLPLRSLALHYLTSHLFPLAPQGTQIENLRPFMSSFSIPKGTEDPLASTSATTEYPLDHLVNFRGNSDDNFRIGIKITRKAWRVVMMPANESKLMECDIIIASPLGIKMQSEREESTDLLSSIEVAVVDGMDVMQMQNWDHVQFVFSHLNKMPKSPHGCDFSRVKNWYLDEQAKYLRQTILMSRYDTPETRSLFHKHCFNLEGKIRLEKNDYPGVLGYIKPGVKQVFERFDGDSRKGLGGDAAVEEVDQRLDWFVKKTIPALQRSAISRQQTLIVVPSYFDYVRLNDYLRRPESKISYAAISEYSSNSEISRARTTFFKGKKDFLIVTERFHFYRRYKLRGAKTLVYYSLPEHAQFYSEFAQTPFLPSRKNGEEAEADVEVEEVSTRVLFSRFDALKLERVVGSVDARRMLGSGEERFVFA